MTDSKHWHVRFGQVLRHRLAETEHRTPGRYVTRLQDCFFFNPEEAEIFAATKPPIDAYKPVDLNKALVFYRKHFTAVKALPTATLDSTLVKRLDASFIIIPDVGHHLIPRAPAILEECYFLNDFGLDLRYLAYLDSVAAFKQSTKKLIDRLQETKRLNKRLVFITHGFSYWVLLEALRDKSIAQLREQTRAIVTLSSPLQAIKPLPETIHDATRAIYQVLVKVSQKDKSPLPAKIIKQLKSLVGLELTWAQVVSELLEKIDHLSDRLGSLPEGIEDFGIPPESWFEQENLSGDVPGDRFSIASITPNRSTTGRVTFPNQIDSLFQALTGSAIAKRLGSYHNHRFRAADTICSAEQGVHLGTVASNHWGLLYPNVLSSVQSDPFPRPAMIESLLLLLDEYYLAETDAQESSDANG